MDLLAVTVNAPVASFRRPLDHTYQRSLPLPPPTTLLGIAGAALGLSDTALWAPESPIHALKVSAISWQVPGKARDLWTVVKIKNNRLTERSPYFRELLFCTRFTLLYGGPTETIAQLYEAFRHPVYPLSLGREDELFLIRTLWKQECQPVPGDGKPFTGTIIPGDVSDHLLRVPLKTGLRIQLPTMEQLPLRFTLDKNHVRHPQDQQTFTFIPPDLTVQLTGIEPVYAFRKRYFTWLN